MATQDQVNNVGFVQALAPVAAYTTNTPVVTSIVDTQNFESLTLAFNIGAIASVGATFTVLVQDGNDSGLSDAATVDAAFLIGSNLNGSQQFVTADANTTKKIGYVGHKRYVRATITPASNGTSAFFDALWVDGFPRFAPVTTF